jgi:hypothetical protein
MAGVTTSDENSGAFSDARALTEAVGASRIG